MAEREIKTRFRLEGESEYRRAMKEAADATKVLNSEQKLAEAQYEATGDAQQYVTSTTEILSNKIKEQEKVADAAQKAIQKLRELGVSDADKLMQDWKIKLNNAQTNLTKYQTDLNNLSVDIQPEKDLASQLDTIANKIDFQNTINAIENIQGKIETVIKTAARAAVAVWNMEADAGKWADDLVTAATSAQMDVETYQSWQYASTFIDTEVSTITSTITRLQDKLGDTNTDVKKLFNELSIPTNTKNSVRNATDVFWDLIDALGAFPNVERRDQIAQDLLGKSWKDLLPLIEAGSQAYQDYAEKGRKTAVVSKENVDALAGLNDVQEDLQASLQKLKLDTLAALAPTFKTVSESLNTAVQSLNEFVQSKEGQEALDKLNEALSGVIKSFLGEDGGKGTFQSIVEGASGAIETFNGMLDWISQNGETVKGIVLGLVAAWGTLTISKDVLILLQLLQHIPLSKLTAAFGSKEAAGAAGAAGAASAAGAAGTAAAGAAGATLSGLVTNAFSGASAVVNAVFSKLGLVGIGTLTGVPMLDFIKDPSKYTNPEAQKKYDELNVDPLSGLRSAAKNPSAVKEGLWALLGAGDSSTAKEAAEKMAEEAGSAAEEAVEKAIATKITTANWEELFKKDPENDIWKQIFGDFDLEWVKQNWQQAAAYMLEVIKAATENNDLMFSQGEDAAEDLAQGIKEGESAVEGAADEAASGAATGAEARLADGSMETIGYNASIGLANGIISGQDAVISAAQALADSAISTLQSGMEIASPSKVMARLGGYVAQGFAHGIDRGVADVERAVARMSGAAFRAPTIAQPQGPRIAQAAPAAMGASGAPGSVSGQQIQAVIMMDKKTVGYLVAPVVNEAIGAIVQEARV